MVKAVLFNSEITQASTPEPFSDIGGPLLRAVGSGQQYNLVHGWNVHVFKVLSVFSSVSTALERISSQYLTHLLKVK